MAPKHEKVAKNVFFDHFLTPKRGGPRAKKVAKNVFFGHFSTPGGSILTILGAIYSIRMYAVRRRRPPISTGYGLLTDSKIAF
jgi:hypothetical protein